jgi:hypothetical protein
MLTGNIMDRAMLVPEAAMSWKNAHSTLDVVGPRSVNSPTAIAETAKAPTYSDLYAPTILYDTSLSRSMFASAIVSESGQSKKMVMFPALIVMVVDNRLFVKSTIICIWKPNS